RGLAHLALKPTNVFVGPAPDRSVHLTDASAWLLSRGANIESRHWLAPEQVSASGPAGPEADIFAMSLVVFHALTGGALVPGSPDPARWAAALANGAAASKRARDLGVTLPEAIDPVLHRSLAIRPGDRPRSAAAFARELAVALDPNSAQMAAHSAY